MFIFSEAMARPLSLLFVGYDKELFEITLRAFFIYSFSYLFSGFSIFSSSFFTALNDGPVSAMISILKNTCFSGCCGIIFFSCMETRWNMVLDCICGSNGSYCFWVIPCM